MPATISEKAVAAGPRASPFPKGSPASPESWGKNRLVGNDEFLCAEIGQVGTQFDGLAHIGTRVTMADGRCLT